MGRYKLMFNFLNRLPAVPAPCFGRAESGRDALGCQSFRAAVLVALLSLYSGAPIAVAYSSQHLFLGQWAYVEVHPAWATPF
jgi:hypothetical protein